MIKLRKFPDKRLSFSANLPAGKPIFLKNSNSPLIFVSIFQAQLAKERQISLESARKLIYDTVAYINGLNFLPISFIELFHTEACNLDRMLTQLTLPSGRDVDYEYDGGGRITGLNYDSVAATFVYNDSTNRVTSNNRDGINYSFAYNGSLLPTGMTVSGEVYGDYSYDNNFNLMGFSLDNGPEVSLAYDLDGLLTQYGSFDIERNEPAGSPSQIRDGAMTITYDYDTIGRPINRTNTVDGQQGNLYVYVGNNPVNLRDPYGLFCIGGSAYGGVGQFCITGEGVSLCAEVGFGIGTSVEVAPFGGLARSGSEVGIQGELTFAGIGPSSELTLDDCGTLKYTGAMKAGPFSQSASYDFLEKKWSAGDFATGGEVDSLNKGWLGAFKPRVGGSIKLYGRKCLQI